MITQMIRTLELVSKNGNRKLTLPIYGMRQVEEANEFIGHHWFSKDTMRFFASRVSPILYGSRYFVSSEKAGFNDPTRVFTIRELKDNGSIDTVGELGEYSSMAKAKTAIKNLLKGQE